jgi:cellulose synthase (UDP-forming)
MLHAKRVGGRADPPGHRTALARGRWYDLTARAVAVFSLVFAAGYIVWRWTHTLNTDALWFSLPLVLAESYGLLTAFFYVFTCWDPLRRQSPPPLPQRSVDVFITTYDEPIDIIRRTAVAARDIRYPHSTFLLDDGRRDAVRVLAQELGIGYLRRDTNEHAKAGNLNHALRHTRGEFLLQLDADHVPLPHIVDRLIGFFEDERVALVQSPQDFYNTDGFTFDVDARSRRIWEDQELFFRTIQPGKNRWNAAFFVGSCALLRRSALEQIGGFATRTVTEDIETSLLLHASGWKTVFYGETLAYGLAPGSASAFQTQHMRWGRGAMQVLRHYRPLRLPGLTLPQRICYLDSLTTYLGGFQKMIFYLSPVVFFLTGVFPVDVDAAEFARVFLPYLGLLLLTFKMLGRGHAFVLLAERYAMAKFFTHMLAVTGYFMRRLPFRVTPKGVAHTSLRSFAPQLLLLVLIAFAVAFGTAAYVTGAVDYGSSGWGPLAFLVNLAWATWNFALAGWLVHLSLAVRQRRADYRYQEVLPVRFTVIDSAMATPTAGTGVIENLNPTGLAFRSAIRLEPGTRIRLRLPLPTAPIECDAEILRRSPSQLPSELNEHYGVRFIDLAREARDLIEQHCAQHAGPMRRQITPRAGSGALQNSLRWLAERRRERRRSVRLPVEVEPVDPAADPRVKRVTQLGLLEEITDGGALIALDEPIAPGTTIFFRVPDTTICGLGQIVFVRASETRRGLRFFMGLRRLEASEAESALTHARAHA